VQKLLWLRHCLTALPIGAEAGKKPSAYGFIFAPSTRVVRADRETDDRPARGIPLRKRTGVAPQKGRASDQRAAAKPTSPNDRKSVHRHGQVTLLARPHQPVALAGSRRSRREAKISKVVDGGRNSTVPSDRPVSCAPSYHRLGGRCRGAVGGLSSDSQSCDHGDDSCGLVHPVGTSKPLRPHRPQFPFGIHSTADWAISTADARNQARHAAASGVLLVTPRERGGLIPKAGQI